MTRGGDLSFIHGGLRRTPEDKLTPRYSYPGENARGEFDPLVPDALFLLLPAVRRCFRAYPETSDLSAFSAGRRDSPSSDSKAGTHADVGSRTLEEGHIVLDVLLPANQDSSASIELPVRAFPLGLVVSIGRGDDDGDRQTGTLGHPGTLGIPLPSIRGMGTGSFSS